MLHLNKVPREVRVVSDKVGMLAKHGVQPREKDVKPGKAAVRLGNKTWGQVTATGMRVLIKTNAHDKELKEKCKVQNNMLFQ